MVKECFIGCELVEFMKKDMPPLEWHIENIIIKSGLTYIYGAPGSFKTNFMLYAMLRATEGKDVFNFSVKKKLNVLWIDEENRNRGMYYKLKQISNGMNYDSTNAGKFIIFYHNNFNILNPRDLEILNTYIKKLDIDIVVIDSIAKVFSEDEIDKKKVKLIFASIKPFLINSKVSFALLHHSRKRQHGQQSSQNEISGSHEFSAQCDDLIYLEEVNVKNNVKRFKLSSQKPRYTIGFQSINFDVCGDDNTLDIVYSGLVSDNIDKAAEEKENKIKAKILDWIVENPQQDYRLTTYMEDLKKYCKCGDTHIRQAIYKSTNSLVRHNMLSYDKGVFSMVIS